MSRLADEDWKEMHALFSSASEPFSYLSPASHEIAERAKARGALVTFDAGPNPHLLVPTRAASDWREWLAEHFSTYEVLEDRAGTGAQVTHVD